MASIGGFFKAIGGFFIGLFPLIKKLLSNPVIKAIVVSKIGQKWYEVIKALIEAADEMDDLTSEAKHAYVVNEARMRGLDTYTAPDAELDMMISGIVAEKRRPDRVRVLTEESRA